MGAPPQTRSVRPHVVENALETSTSITSTTVDEIKSSPEEEETTDANSKEVDLLAICSMPMDRGPCYAAKPRFFYDRESGECRPFRFGGCDGNRNNFLTKEECVLTCGWVKEASKAAVQGWLNENLE
jgi:hypothetical protein